MNVPAWNPATIRLCGVTFPPKRLKIGAHALACSLLLLDVLGSLLLAAYVPHLVVMWSGAGGKLGAAIESVSMFIQEEAAH